MTNQLLLSDLIFTTVQPGFFCSALSRACAAVGQVDFGIEHDLRPAYTVEPTSELAFAGRNWPDDIVHATSSATTLMARYIKHSLLDSSEKNRHESQLVWQRRMRLAHYFWLSSTVHGPVQHCRDSDRASFTRPQHKSPSVGFRDTEN